jgi:hypothetical protein
VIRLPHSVRSFEVEGDLVRFVCECDTVWIVRPRAEPPELECEEGDPTCTMPSVTRRWREAEEALALLGLFTAPQA